MPVVVVISQHLLNVFVQLANKRGFKKNIYIFCWTLRFVGRTEENYEQSFRRTGAASEIGTGHLLNTRRDGYRLGNPFGGCHKHNILKA
jgi:hypothetical protein